MLQIFFFFFKDRTMRGTAEAWSSLSCPSRKRRWRESLWSPMEVPGTEQGCRGSWRWRRVTGVHLCAETTRRSACRERARPTGVIPRTQSRRSKAGPALNPAPHFFSHPATVGHLDGAGGEVLRALSPWEPLLGWGCGGGQWGGWGPGRKWGGRGGHGVQELREGGLQLPAFLRYFSDSFLSAFLLSLLSLSPSLFGLLSSPALLPPVTLLFPLFSCPPSGDQRCSGSELHVQQSQSYCIHKQARPRQGCPAFLLSSRPATVCLGNLNISPRQTKLKKKFIANIFQS